MFCLNDSSYRFFRILLPNLLEVVRYVVRGEAGVAEDEVVGMLAGDFGDGGLVHVLVEAGHEVVVGDAPDGLARDFALQGCWRAISVMAVSFTSLSKQAMR